ncbi:MAG: amidophosphoribosyltransferase [Methanomassiliicoccales archaeon PtaU1.Bin124]|nr:MAG: amidophosphoribosyltransferase [Methanomassiliicoccales archaeon PtaU1.Bin124]
MIGYTKELIGSREWMMDCALPKWLKSEEAEGGCGVVGLTSTVPVEGKHFFEALAQMHNRGNGKGGGIAAVGLMPEQMGVSREVLDSHYLIQVAYIRPEVREELENEHIKSNFLIHKSIQVDESKDPGLLARLEVRPPTVVRYFCRARPEVLEAFIKEKGLQGLERARAEDEFVNQSSFRINHKYYATSNMAAFVMSQGRNMLIMKIVGYAEDVIRYYRMEEFRANIWIGHQRYPTKGKVWHPGGAHPFMGLDEALVHNGDFANYYAVSEYLAQRNVTPLFLTDTEVSVLLFDLLNRTYRYPLEYILEALAPTTERDFHQLSPEKQALYHAIQSTHMHASPDGPWFFIIARNCHYDGEMQLIGITDTSMLRPQVFAVVEGDMRVALVASEKQAIDATLTSLSQQYPSVPKRADVYWNARGGSHTDGGAFIFNLRPDGKGLKLTVTNKFGAEVSTNVSQWDQKADLELATPTPNMTPGAWARRLAITDAEPVFQEIVATIPKMSVNDVQGLLSDIASSASLGPSEMKRSIDLLTLLIDRRYPTGPYRRSRLVTLYEETLNRILRSIPVVQERKGGRYARVDVRHRAGIVVPADGQEVLAIDCRDFPMEGDEGPSFAIVEGVRNGWKNFIMFDAHGQRFFGCGIGSNSKGVRIDAYGTPGDYLASGLDGAEIVIHGNGQDQLGQILGSGKLVVHGDVGQTFMYGAKGGEVFIMGNAAGRPLINAVGRPRVLINGTCLDYLAESFMAGDPLNGGGFVILNGMKIDAAGVPVELPAPYPGGNLFSLASGGAIYIRDPHQMVGEDQLNGGRISKLTASDWDLILPYLQENERLFSLKVGDLLTVEGQVKEPDQVYRKVEAVPVATAANKVALNDDESAGD